MVYKVIAFKHIYRFISRKLKHFKLIPVYLVIRYVKLTNQPKSFLFLKNILGILAISEILHRNFCMK